MQIESAKEIVLPDLSYKIIGAAFEVFNELGWGLPEKDYQIALSKELKELGFNVKREVYIPLKYKTSNISRYFADFVVDDKILLEIKVVSRLGYFHARQILTYLRTANLRLGILLYFTQEGVKYRRVLNSHY
ncbi:MAG: GxxExxY protein [Candidatus Wolfebacteria bacterium]|nr:GxxExxY protein [Candidatus Wolfebacteria bacterium]